VVPSRAAPVRDRMRPLLPPVGVVPALDAQLDLRQLESDESVRVYENAAWAPVAPAERRTSPLRWMAVAIEVSLWVVAVRALVRRRRVGEHAL
jgi:hypothetical protein